MKVFVGNLAPQVTEERLSELMAPYGKPTTLSIVRDKSTGASRGFAFVEFGTPAESKSAIAGLDGKEIEGQALRVNEAHDRKAKGAGA